MLKVSKTNDWIDVFVNLDNRNAITASIPLKDVRAFPSCSKEDRRQAIIDNMIESIEEAIETAIFEANS